ncbi:hypothetical protein [Chitinophaga qingshengii]|uniref:Lipoprotein n=1 Tax=Chitinophaga qingshengii TaxID=1569794 RepID=A0ABR7TZ63_9BACT|nr:hypothetical protein [Chitinophaga qingshengii]MBC9934916.1 hypothetical protein [Chitinophaga qingshengii]
MRKILVVLMMALTAYTSGCKSQNKNSMSKEYTVQTLEGPYPVNKRVEKLGYKVIGEWKLWNPNPLPVSDSDIVFIKTKLPEWLAEKAGKPDDRAVSAFQQVPDTELRKQLRYSFTFFGPGLTETDAYLLQLKYDNKPVNIYIPKSDSGIVYPFKDEEWNRNLSYNDKK